MKLSEFVKQFDAEPTWDDIDSEIDLLRADLRVRDQRLRQLESGINPDDPDSFVLYDNINHECGLGFVACQRYLTGVIGWYEKATQEIGRDEPKKTIDSFLSLGPALPTKLTYASAINAAANFWKHSTANVGSIHEPTRRTIEQLGLSLTDEHVAARVFETMDVGSFSALLPILTEWRDRVLSPLEELGASVS
jgi:hypothetical protein